MIAAMNKDSLVLEINLISAQRLKLPGGARAQTYALAWVDSAAKLRTGVDKVGGENPTWNDRFLFRVSPEFLAGATSGVDVEIYAVGFLRDSLIGSVRLLIGNFLDLDLAARSPSFTALQIRRPSGRFRGVLNVGAMVIPSSDFMAARPAVGYRDLMGRQSRRRDRRKEPENFSDGDDSSTTSSSSSSSAMKDLNSIRDLGLKASAMPHCSGFLCGLLRDVQIQSRPSDERKIHHDDSSGSFRKNSEDLGFG